jgi:hypothetical protein
VISEGLLDDEGISDKFWQIILQGIFGQRNV